LKQAAALFGGVSVTSMLSDVVSAREAQTVRHLKPDADRVTARGGLAVVETDSGKVAGYIRNGIFTFKGIPYADSTEGVNRFMPPRKPKPWSGVRSSRQYGPVSPQGHREGWAHDEEAFTFAWDDGVQGEDCLRVNVWTPGIHDGKKRPVMVWLHGGGFVAGSGQELRSYDGENLARRGDTVIVSLNHRLSIFGYLDLSDYGSQYESSANVGMLDIVAALQWVRDNIAAFGGDPGTVTIFGQSGGGGKVGTLMAMPVARGLFDRAIVESGSMLKLGTREMAPYPRIHLKGLDPHARYRLRVVAGKAEDNTPVEASGTYWASEGIQLMLTGDFQAAAVVLDRQPATGRADSEGR
jgi:para-nitrobenzyl esterase